MAEQWLKPALARWRMLSLISLIMFSGCFSKPGIYYGTESKTVVLFEDLELDLRDIAPGTIEIKAVKQQEIVRGNLNTIEQGYRPFPYGGKALEMGVYFPLSLIFYPVPLLIPLSFYEAKAAVLPFLLLYPFKPVVVNYEPTVSTGKVLKREWEIESLEEMSQSVPGANCRLEVTWLPTGTTSVVETNAEGVALIALDRVIPPHSRNRQGRLEISSPAGGKKIYRIISQQRLQQIGSQEEKP